MTTLAAYQWKSRAIPTVAVAGRGTRRHSADRPWPPVERSDVETRRTRWAPEAGRDNKWTGEPASPLSCPPVPVRRAFDVKGAGVPPCSTGGAGDHAQVGGNAAGL